MEAQTVLDEFRAAGALLEGHFILSSGRHSRVYLQKNLVFRDPRRTERLCAALAAKIRSAVGQPDVVISPAVGAIIPGYETARQLGVESIFLEREQGAFRLRRGFALRPGARVVLVEDIVTTGLSSRECVDAIRVLGGDVICVACVVDRSGGAADPGAALVALAEVNAPSYAPDACPADLMSIPVEDPGSRRLVSA